VTVDSTEATVAIGDARFAMGFSIAPDAPVSVAWFVVAGVTFDVPNPVPLVEVAALGYGNTPASPRIAHTTLGALLRYQAHRVTKTPLGESLEIDIAGAGIVVTALLERVGSAAIRAHVVVLNASEDDLILQSVPSWTVGFGRPRGMPPLEDEFGSWRRISGRSDWLGENRWTTTPMRDDFPVLSSALTNQNPRGAYIASSQGTWSTGGTLPVAAVESPALGLSWAWQIEHNGPWRWEIGEDLDGGYFCLSGPTERDASWSVALTPGESFETVPVSVALGSDFTAAIGALTEYRRIVRRAAPDDQLMPVVFNDYMNTLNGDPTTDRLLPLVSMAASVGAEVFCIDAGWYDDSGAWWDSVGEWRPSETRFPNGLGEVISAIRGAGMIPGLWLEPESIGIRSEVATQLPPTAFLSRKGHKVVEHDRLHLDLRDATAVAHLDSVLNRLVSDFGIGYFKFDYNINPGAGTDHDSDSIGDGLLQHARAYQAWLDRLLERYPHLVIENCASGAMRADFALLSRLALQSTSDQQDPLRYPPIAASAPVTMLPEQAANWAYPQAEMDDEGIAFTLVTGLAGCLYLSGHLDRMLAQQRAIVASAVAVAKSSRNTLRTSTPYWPIGLPAWDDPWVALGLRGAAEDTLSLWWRGGKREIELEIPHLKGLAVEVETIFPTALTAWTTEWSQEGTLRIRAGSSAPSARTLRLRYGTQEGGYSS
jgi:alpha-galactosidase